MYQAPVIHVRTDMNDSFLLGKREPSPHAG